MKVDKENKLCRKTFVVIVACTVFGYCICQGLNTSTTVYMSITGISGTFAGIAGVIFSAAAGVTRLAVGPIVDARGRARCITIGAIVLMVGVVLPLLGNSLSLMMVARLLQGFGFSALSTSAAAAAVDVLPKARLDEGIGYYGLGQAFAMAVGPTLGLFLVMLDPASWLFWGMLGLSVVALVLSLAIRYERNPSELPVSSTYRQRFENSEVPYAKPAGSSVPISRAPLKDILFHNSNGASFLSTIIEKKSLPGAVPALVINPIYGFAIFYIGLYATTIGIENPGLFFFIAAIAMVIMRMGSKYYLGKFKALWIMAGCNIAAIIAFVMLLLLSQQSPVLFYPAGIFYGISLGISYPLLQGVCVKCAPPERWGVANAMFLLAYDIGAGGGALVWGIMIDCVGFSTCFAFIFALIVASFLVAWKMFPKDVFGEKQ